MFKKLFENKKDTTVSFLKDGKIIKTIQLGRLTEQERVDTYKHYRDDARYNVTRDREFTAIMCEEKKETSLNS